MSKVQSIDGRDVDLKDRTVTQEKNTNQSVGQNVRFHSYNIPGLPKSEQDVANDKYQVHIDTRIDEFHHRSN